MRWRASFDNARQQRTVRDAVDCKTPRSVLVKVRYRVEQRPHAAMMPERPKRKLCLVDDVDGKVE